MCVGKMMQISLIYLCFGVSNIFFAEGLKCWECDVMGSVEECKMHGKLTDCEADLDVCATAFRDVEGSSLKSGMRISMFCYKKFACTATAHNMTGEPSPSRTWCNSKLPDSVCTCCCDKDKCNVDLHGCLNQGDKKACTPVAHPRNGFVDCIAANNIGSQCSFVCQEDHYLHGVADLKCEQDGMWSDAQPQCHRITCPGLPRLGDGFVRCTDRAYLGSVCRFSCEYGFQLIGSDESACQRGDRAKTTGEWTTAEQRCIAKQCKRTPEAPENGFVNCTSGNRMGSVCEFGCNKGYDPEGETVIKCAKHSAYIEWSHRAPICKRRQCYTELNPPANGFISCSDGAVSGSVCEFSCKLGYFVDGAENSICTDAKQPYGSPQWSDESPVCKKNECDSLPELPINGRIICSHGKFVKSVCEFVCPGKFTLVGSDMTTCVSDRLNASRTYWDKSTPVCQAKVCSPAPVVLQGGRITCSDGNNLGSVCKFECNNSFYRIGFKATTCRKGRHDYRPSWNHAVPVCKRKECNRVLEAPMNGYINCTNANLLDSICDFSCDHLHKRVGYRFSTCLENRRDGTVYWDNTEPKCIRKQCNSKPRAPTNGHMKCTDVNYVGSICIFVCDYFYNLLGPERTTCRENDQFQRVEWDENSPKCIRKECSHMPTVPEHGNMTCSDEKYYGSVCAFTCVEGYERIGVPYIFCGFIGEKDLGKPSWDYKAPVCQKQRCNMPLVSLNGFMHCTDHNFKGSECEYICEDFYRRVGPLKTKCAENEDGKLVWTNESPPVCERITCQRLENLTFGRTECSDGDFVNSECKFTCSEQGYELFPSARRTVTCQNDTNWSQKQPCCARLCPPHAVMDLIVLLDSSSSIGHSNWKNMLKFVNDIFHLFTVRKDAMNFGVVRYNSLVDSETEINLKDCSDDADVLRERVSKLPFDGKGTYTGQALMYAKENMFLPANGNRPHVPDVVLVITDGRSQDDVRGPAEALRKTGVLVFALGITPTRGKLDMEQLLQIAGQEPNNVIVAKKGFRMLTPAFAAEIKTSIQPFFCDVPRNN